MENRSKMARFRLEDPPAPNSNSSSCDRYFTSNFNIRSIFRHFPRPVSRPMSSYTDDPRLGSLIIPLSLEEVISRQQTARAHKCVAIVGFGYDEGTRRNNGRIGGSSGPTEVRKQLYRLGTVMNPEHDVSLDSVVVYDCGDVTSGLPLELAHDELTTSVRKLLDCGCIPFVIGGSNDQSFANGRALIEHLNMASEPLESLTIVNIDAHLDVRPLNAADAAVRNQSNFSNIPADQALLVAHSGSPFRQLLELSSPQRPKLVEFAAQGMQCSAAHADWVKVNGGEIFWLSKIQQWLVFLTSFIRFSQNHAAVPRKP